MGVVYSLTATGLPTVRLGHVTRHSDTISFSNTVIKMPTMPSRNTFVIDSGCKESVQLTFTHRSGDDGVTNATWLTNIRQYVDRWQADTDGCLLNVVPDGDSDEEQAREAYNVYINDMTTTYDTTSPELVSVSLTLKVGSMYGKGYGTQNPDIPMDEFYIMLSDSRGQNWFYLMNPDYTCVEEYSIFGGMNQPFEYIELTVPKRRLADFIPEMVVEDDIVAGKNQLIVNGVGSGNFIVTRCKLSDDTYRLTAYAYPEAFRGTPTTTTYTEVWTPMDIIQDILKTGVNIENISVAYSGDAVISHFERDNNRWSGAVEFPEGSNAWYVMQVCAYRLHCKIFFAEGLAYIIDPSLSEALDYSSTPLHLFSSDNVSVAQDILGLAELGDEGTSALCTKVGIGYTDGDEVKIQVAPGYLNSVEYYGERGYKEIRIPEIKNSEDAGYIGLAYCDFLCDTQTSIGFKIRERTSKGWHRRFDVTSAFSEIHNEFDDIVVSNHPKSATSESTRRYQILTQSTFERHYPDGYSEYWYGILQTNDLTQTVSQILTAIGNN